MIKILTQMMGVIHIVLLKLGSVVQVKSQFVLRYLAMVSSLFLKNVTIAITKVMMAVLKESMNLDLTALAFPQLVL